MMMNDWFCTNCELPTSLDQHGFCDRCGSDAVDRLRYPVQPKWQAEGRPAHLALWARTELAKISSPQQKKSRAA